jgi:hypothetical protein
MASSLGTARIGDLFKKVGQRLPAMCEVQKKAKVLKIVEFLKKGSDLYGGFQGC